MSLIKNIKIFLEDNQNEILIAIIVTLLSSSVSNVGTSLAENILSPLANIDLNRDGKSDKQNLEEWVVNISGAEIKIGKFILSLLELLIILIIISILNSYIKK